MFLFGRGMGAPLHGDFPLKAWLVSFGSGGYGWNWKEYEYAFRCVRGGP
jgi:hypothetical protein